MSCLFSRQIAAVALAAVFSVSAVARDEPDWNNLGTLKSGARIGIIQSDLKRIEGIFASFSGSGISVLTDREITVPKEKVIRVYRRPRINRGVRTVIGALIGVGCGAILNGTIGQYLRNEAHGVASGVWIAAGAGAGAGIGAATGGGKHTVYRRSAHP